MSQWLWLKINYTVYEAGDGILVQRWMTRWLWLKINYTVYEAGDGILVQRCMTRKRFAWFFILNRVTNDSVVK